MLCSALISKKLLIPFLFKSSLIKASDFLSILLRTVIKVLFNFLNLERISKSSLFRFCDPSSRNIIKLDSSAAIHACSAISSFRQHPHHRSHYGESLKRDAYIQSLGRFD